MLAASPLDGLISVFAVLAVAVPVTFVAGVGVSALHRKTAQEVLKAQLGGRREPHDRRGLKSVDRRLLMSDVTKWPSLREGFIQAFGEPESNQDQPGPTGPIGPSASPL